MEKDRNDLNKQKKERNKINPHVKGNMSEVIGMFKTHLIKRIGTLTCKISWMEFHLFLFNGLEKASMGKTTSIISSIEVKVFSTTIPFTQL